MLQNGNACHVFCFSLERTVKDIVHRAFWDSLEAQLKEDPPSYEHAIKLLGEIKEVRPEANQYE